MSTERPLTSKEITRAAAHARIERTQSELRQAVEDADATRIIRLARELRSAQWTLRPRRTKETQ